MIAYDITRRSTFDSVIHWIKEVELYGAANVVLVLIGKCVCFFKVTLFNIVETPELQVLLL